MKTMRMGGNGNVAVNKVIASCDKTYISVNETAQITVAVTPTGANQEVTYESSDTSIATVSENGVVTGIKSGNVTITVTSKVDTSKNATVSLEIRGLGPENFDELADAAGLWLSDDNSGYYIEVSDGETAAKLYKIENYSGKYFYNSESVSNLTLDFTEKTYEVTDSNSKSLESGKFETDVSGARAKLTLTPTAGQNGKVYTWSNADKKAYTQATVNTVLPKMTVKIDFEEDVGVTKVDVKIGSNTKSYNESGRSVASNSVSFDVCEYYVSNDWMEIVELKAYDSSNNEISVLRNNLVSSAGTGENFTGSTGWFKFVENATATFTYEKVYPLNGVQNIFVAGSFNDWVANDENSKMTLESGTYKKEITMPKDASFKFVFDFGTKVFWYGDDKSNSKKLAAGDSDSQNCWTEGTPDGTNTAVYTLSVTIDSSTNTATWSCTFKEAATTTYPEQIYVDGVNGNWSSNGNYTQCAILSKTGEGTYSGTFTVTSESNMQIIYNGTWYGHNKDNNVTTLDSASDAWKFYAAAGSTCTITVDVKDLSCTYTVNSGSGS